MSTKHDKTVEPLLTTTSVKSEAYNQSKSNHKIYIFIVISLILIIAAALLIYFLLTVDESSTTYSCNCNRDGFIQLDSDSCVLPLRDGFPPGSVQLANDIFNATGFTVNDYINTTDANGLPWVLFNETIQQYVWRYKWDFNAFLLLTKDDNNNDIKILIDAAVGIISPSIVFANNAQLYSMLLERNCDDVDIVIATHMHADHTGWFIKYDSVDEQSIVHTFTNARYIVSTNEYEFWANSTEDMKQAVRLNERFPPIMEDNQLELRSEDNYFIAPKVQVMNCSGHTIGHQCVVFYGDNYLNETNNQSYMFWGDLIHREIQVSKPEIYPPFDMDPITAMNRRIEILNFIYDNDMIVFPAHFNVQINPGKIVYCDTCFATNNFSWLSIEL